MDNLQTAFYIVGIVFMSCGLLLLIIMAVAMLVIRAKINAIHRSIDQKLEFLYRGKEVLDTVKNVVKKVR